MPPVGMPSAWDGITFGIELEFMTPPPKSKGRTITDIASRLHIAEILAHNTSLPVACTCTSHLGNPSCPVCFDAPPGAVAGNIRILSSLDFPRRPNSQVESNVFLVLTEFLETRHPINMRRRWPGVEVSTPIFGSGEILAGLPKMKSVLDVLRRSGVEITADESCGLHVHVGVEEGMTLLLAKKILTLVILLEDAILLRCISPTRLGNYCAEPLIQPTGVSRNGWTEPEGAIPLLESHVPPIKPSAWNGDKPEHFHLMFRQMWSATSLQGLSKLIRQGTITRCAVALSLRNGKGQYMCGASTADLEGTPSTVEFRYSQMSFDLPYLRNWVELVTRIVHLAKADATPFKECCASICEVQEKADESGVVAWKMLMGSVLKLGHCVPEWQIQMAKYRRGEIFSHLDDNMLLRSP
ncbi:hypothetical protein ACJ41O_007509 [Fusarium nematophilum]